MRHESPIEQALAEGLARYLDPACRVESQVEAQTICGRFRLDLVATTASGRRVAIECDGKDFHDPRRDEWRTAMLLGDGCVDALVRLPGSGIVYHLTDCLFALRHLEPGIFGPRGMQLEILASNEARLAVEAAGQWRRVDLLYPGRVVVERFQVVKTGRQEFWTVLHAAAKRFGGGSLDEVMAKWAAERPMAPKDGGR